jgi:hypothetical protein
MQQHRRNKGYGRGELDLEEDAKEQEGAQKPEPRELGEWVEIAKRNTEFYSNEKACDLLASLDQYASEKGYNINVSDKKYKMKVQILQENNDAMEMMIRILKVSEEQNAVEFALVSGEKKDFLAGFNEFKSALVSISDARIAA